MPNPAHLLHEQLTKWNHAAQPAKQTRNPRSEQWQAHRLMVKHLDAIAELLRILEAQGRNVTRYRECFPKWCDAVFAFPMGWESNGSAAIDDVTLAHLETLAERLDGEIPTIGEGTLTELQEYANAIRELLVEDMTLPAELKLHIGQILGHLDWCLLNFAAAGDFEVRVATERLLAAVAHACRASGMREKWANVANKFMWPYAVGALTPVSATFLTQLVAGS